MKLGMFLPLLGFHSNEGVMFTQLQRWLWTHEVSLGSGAASTCSGDVPRTAHYWQRWPRGLSRFQFSWSIPSCAFGWYVPQQLLEPSQSLAVIPFIGACLWLPIAFLQVYCACSICACSLFVWWTSLKQFIWCVSWRGWRDDYVALIAIGIVCIPDIKFPMSKV